MVLTSFGLVYGYMYASMVCVYSWELLEGEYTNVVLTVLYQCGIMLLMKGEVMKMSVQLHLRLDEEIVEYMDGICERFPGFNRNMAMSLMLAKCKEWDKLYEDAYKEIGTNKYKK